MKHPSKLTNTAIVRRYEILSERISKLVSKLCDEGYGNLRFSELRQINNAPKFVQKYLKYVDESVSLRMEAEMRYGPGMISVRQLVYKSL